MKPFDLSDVPAPHRDPTDLRRILAVAREVVAEYDGSTQNTRTSMMARWLVATLDNNFYGCTEKAGGVSRRVLGPIKVERAGSIIGISLSPKEPREPLTYASARHAARMLLEVADEVELEG